MAIALSAEALRNLMVASIDVYIRGEAQRIDVQSKPLLARIERMSKGITGGLEYIVRPVSWGERPKEHGFEGDEILQFSNPTTLREVRARWYNRHIGMQITIDELQRNGLTLSDMENGISVSDVGGEAHSRIVNLFEHKLEDMRIGREESRNAMFWGDGSASPKDVPGIRYWVQDDPTVPALVGGIDQGAVPEWRNRAVLGIVANAANATDQVLMQTLQREWRQLTRWGRKPNVFLVGSDFMEQLEREYGARGTMFDRGFARGSVEISKPGFTFNGIELVWDPHLDDIGRSKYGYLLNLGRGGIEKYHLNGWKDRRSNPARPENKLVFYTSLVTTDALIATDRRSSGVYSIQ